ncbi:MAG: hypothetical protein K5644_03860, partial [Lachnospiraceae bacterium]|nr:hypothetical protein [Lachnospiraceae bacterium]
MKRILVFAATGAMGYPLVETISQNSDYEVYATSRKEHHSDQIHWLHGNGKDLAWARKIITEYKFDGIIDFLNYQTEEFRNRYEFLLSNTSHYIFLSSARVYAPCNGLITEASPRILDICADEEYLSKDSYDLAKARCENLLNTSKFENYTIIRPSLTYNSDRLQFTIFEKDEWMYRILDGNSIIFPAEMSNVQTTMTYGRDVAYVISKLMLNPNTFGETYNVSGGGSRTWGEVLDIYCKAIKENSHYLPKVIRIHNVEQVVKNLNRYNQYKYARGISRCFSNRKVESILGKINWSTMEEGLTSCIQFFFQSGAHVTNPSFRMAAYFDRLTNECTP